MLVRFPLCQITVQCLQYTLQAMPWQAFPLSDSLGILQPDIEKRQEMDSP